MKHNISFFLLALFLLFWGCSKGALKTPEGPNEPACRAPGLYEVNLPPGKLPWPHHAPGLNEAGYQQLQDELWVVNNFGQYQCGDAPEDCYFHDGLDIVLDNGTPVYAIESGTLKTIAGNGPYYWSAVVEDEDEPGRAWVYAHIIPEEGLKAGDVLQRGACLGTVSFQGLEHLHLSRAYLKEGGAWRRFADWFAVSPDSFFVYTDLDPPVIETPFYFFRDNSPEQFAGTDTATVNGKVDIVVGMRDPGRHAHSKTTLYGDRLCVRRIAFEILKEGQVLARRTAFDFSRMHLNRDNVAGKVATVFKFHLYMNPDFEFGDWNRFVSHYIITNSDGSGNYEPGEVGNRAGSWDTAALNGQGESLYPDGLYMIRAYAWDYSGNEAVAESLVVVDNG